MARTQSAVAHRIVLKATLESIAEHGIEATSMDAIVRACGVSKATIYKHWADKDALLLDAMVGLNELHARPTFDSGDTRADMVAVLAYRPEQQSDIRERAMPHFIAYAAINRPFGMAWRNMAISPPRQDLTRLLQAGIRKGELPPDLDLEVCLALLLGPSLYWYVFMRKTAPHPRRFAEGVVDAFWRAFGVENSA